MLFFPRVTTKPITSLPLIGVAPTSIRNSQDTFILLAFILSAAGAAILYTGLHIAGNPHASAICVAFVYAILLPVAVLTWWVHRARPSATVQIPSLLAPVLILFGVCAVALSLYAYPGRIVSDESAYEFQARIFAAGKLKAVPLPGATGVRATTPPWIYFEQTIQSPTGWFSKYPPGWPALLAVGYLLHCPWLINPMFGLVQLLLVWRISRKWGPLTQAVALISLATSSFFLFTNAGYMSHASNATICLLSIVCVLRGVRTRQLRWIWACFLLVIVAVEVRPYTGAVLGLLCTTFAVAQLKNTRALLVRTLAVIFTTALLATALFLVGNYLFTGDIRVTPYALARGGASIRELTLDPLQIAHNLANVWRWSLTETIRVTFPFLLLFAAFACWRERHQRAELICLAAFLPLLVLACSFQAESSGSIDGERFYYEGLCGLSIVGARGFTQLASHWRIPARCFLVTLVVLNGLQLAMGLNTLRDVGKLLVPYRNAYRLSHPAGSRQLVFLVEHVPDFTPKDVNWNEANWPQARTLYLPDPGEASRVEVACTAHRPFYRVVQYDGGANRFVMIDRQADCHY